jgi:D-erythronate 2-dehydrogenase
VGCCVDNLLAAAALPADRLAARRTFALPVLRLTLGDLVEGLARRFGADRRGLVAYQPDPGLEAAFGAYPPLDCAAAEAVGFHHDGSIEALIDAAIAPGCQKDSSP